MSTPENENPADQLDASGGSDDVTLEFPAAEESQEQPAAELTPDDQIARLRAELAEAEKRVLIAHADLDNFRRRNLRETQEQIRYASSTLMTEILEAVDNLGRAVDSYDTDKNGDGLNEGVKLIAGQISAILQKHGCEKIEAVGNPFDPNLHQALQMQPSAEFEANIVSADLRSGFKLHDRVLRPSQVFVSTGPQ